MKKDFEYSKTTLGIAMDVMKHKKEYKLANHLVDFLIWMECLNIESPDTDNELIFTKEILFRFPEFKSFVATGEVIPIKVSHEKILGV